MLTENQLRAQISSIRHRSNSERSVIGIAVQTRWNGPDQLQVDGNAYRLFPAETDLELRAALLEPLPEGTSPVVLTTLDTKDIGEDVLYRFARRRIHTPSAKEILCDLFKVKDIDPQLHSLKWLASALADARPTGGYPTPPQGTLDQETAWSVFLQSKLGLTLARPDLPALHLWARQPHNVARWQSLEPDQASAAESWLNRSAGTESALVFAALRRDTGASTLTLGLVADLLFRREDLPSDIAVARGSFEARYFDAIHLTAEAGKAFASAALTALRGLDVSETDVREEISQTDAILKSLRIDEHAEGSDFSPLGWTQRITTFAKQLRAWIKKKTPDGLRAVCTALSAVEKHRAASREVETVHQAHMALRLCRWLAQGGAESKSPSFVGCCQRYTDDLSFVDWARYVLFHGHSNEGLNGALEELVEETSELRERFNHEFALGLSAWTEAGSFSAELGLIEQVLAERVAPLAKVSRVLMIVLDGLSFAIYRQITTGLIKDNWAEAIPSGQSQSLPVIAGIPTVTEWSRRLLLSGRPDIAPGADEAAAFRDAPAFQGVVKSNHPAILFRKADLTDSGGRSVSESVREEIVSTTRQVVGVVINAIDDHLAKDDQLRVAWPLAQIPLLQQVLDLARSAGRCVVITSDHGHVVTHHATRITDAPNDRYRIPAGQPLVGEIHLRQGRAGAFAQSGVFVPWTERGYYTSRRNGLHGGITPQEVLVPGVVFCPISQAPEGWTLIPQRHPDWWLESKPAAAADTLLGTPASPPAPAKKTKAVRTAEATLPLFAATGSPPDATDWIEILFASLLYQEQYSRVGRNPPHPETVRKVLRVLKERQGTVLKSVLAQSSGEPEIRLPGLLAMLRRILNVEGYQVLSVDEASSTVRLDLKLLKTQFDLPA